MLEGLAFTSLRVCRGALVAPYDSAVALDQGQSAAEETYDIVSRAQAVVLSDARDFRAEREKQRLVPWLTRWHDREFGLRFGPLLRLSMPPVRGLLPVLWGCRLSLLTP